MATAIASEKPGTSQKTAKNLGRVVQVIGPVLDVEFEPEHLPEIYNALTLEDPAGTVPVTLTAEVQQHIGQNQVRAVAMSSTDGVTRGMEVTDTGGRRSPRRWARRRSAGSSTCWASRWTAAPPLPADTERWPIHRETPEVHRPRAQDRDLRDRHQGHRPDRAVREGRQDRPVRRRRRGQDGRHPGAHQQRRQGPRRPVGLLRRGRADPRGERPLPRVEGSRDPRERGAHLRPDERAARRAAPGRPHRPHGRRVFPRRRGPGRAALHRQHLPLHPGGLRGVGAAGPDAERGGLSADAGHGDGRPAGADHLDHQGLDHLGAGHLRARRRPDRPGAGDGVRAPRRDGRALARDRRARHLPRGRSARQLVSRAFSIRSTSASGTTTSPSACSALCSATRSCRTSSRSWAWTS